VSVRVRVIRDVDGRREDRGRACARSRSTESTSVVALVVRGFDGRALIEVDFPYEVAANRKLPASIAKIAMPRRTSKSEKPSSAGWCGASLSF